LDGKKKSRKHRFYFINKVDFKNSNAYIGIYTNPYLSGMGRMLIECLKKLAFDEGKLHTLKLEVIEDNERAVNFL